MYKNIIIISSVLFSTTLSQQCVLSERSPSNPPTANCDKSFFDPVLSPNDPCICCTPTGKPDDNPPDECLNAPIPTPNKTAIGTLICNENFDCCSCSALKCQSCAALQCSGDSACIGISNINVDGNCAVAGAKAQCNGDFSCFRTGITGECVTALDCNGDNSCGESLIKLNLNTEIPDRLSPIVFIFNGDDSVPKSTIYAKNVGGFTCGGDGACEETKINIECKSNHYDKGCKVEVGGDNAAIKSVWNVNMADFVSCKGDRSCEGTKFDIICVSKGCPVTFTGDNSAPNVVMKLTNANTISCAGDESCMKGIYNIDCVNDRKGCPLSITGEMAARESNWIVSNLNLFKCVGVNACVSSVFDLKCESKGCSIACSGSCKDTSFTVLNSKGIICNGAILNRAGQVIGGTCENSIFKLDNNVDNSILCDGEQSCQNTRISDSLGGCVSNIKAVKCSATQSCFGIDASVKPKDVTFIFSCDGQESCRNGLIDIMINKSKIRGIGCNSILSCSGATFDIGKENGGALKIDGIFCGGPKSCQDSQTNIINTGKIDVGEINCGAAQSCLRKNVNINITGNGKFVSVIKCGGMLSCQNFKVTIIKNRVPADTRDYSIKVFGCRNTMNCQGATINGVPFDRV